MTYVKLEVRVEHVEFKIKNMNKDWKGNGKSIYTTLGASNHVEEEREKNDYYATDPIAVKLLMQLENLNEFILEPSCGEGHLSKELEKEHRVTSSDLIDRGYGEILDFFSIREFTGDIVTNPPYSMSEEFVRHSLNIIPEGNKICMFLKLQFLEGQKRRKLFEEFPPIRIWISSSRIMCAKNGDFESISSSAVAYAWFIWQKGFKGKPTVDWFN